jgi:hypothetical protein
MSMQLEAYFHFVFSISVSTNISFSFFQFKYLDHGVIGYINYYKSGNTTGTITSVPYLVVIDRWALVVFTILFFAYQIGTIIWMYIVPLKKRRMMFEKDDHNRLHITSNLTNPKVTFIEGL